MEKPAEAASAKAMVNGRGSRPPDTAAVTATGKTSAAAAAGITELVTQDDKLKFIDMTIGFCITFCEADRDNHKFVVSVA